jgi:hypothetical protein
MSVLGLVLVLTVLATAEAHMQLLSQLRLDWICYWVFADLLLKLYIFLLWFADEEPWLNETTGCTFPSPWARSTPEQVVTFPARHGKIFRELSAYEGVYTHEAFGDFTVTFHPENSTLSYRFGILLNGQLNPAEDPDDFHMTIGHPLTYRMAFYPQYPNGFPIYFDSSEQGDIVSVTVPYFESSFPPTFNKQ